MKNLLFILSLFFLILFSCSSSDSPADSENIPLAPTNLIGEVVSTTEINLSWTDNSTNETGFKIERRTGTETYSIVGTVNANVLLFNDNNLSPGTTYVYRVYSYNTAGNSSTYSNELDLKTQGLVPTALLGKWFLNKNIFNSQEQNLTACDKQANITFNESNTFIREYYWFDGTNCLTEGVDNGTFEYDSVNNSITLSFTDANDGAQTELLHILTLTVSSFIYEWDEGNTGVNNSQVEWIK
jgi:hypothetical protein